MRGGIWKKAQTTIIANIVGEDINTLDTNYEHGKCKDLWRYIWSSTSFGDVEER